MAVKFEKMTFPEDANPVIVFSGQGALQHAYDLLDGLGVATGMVVCGQTVGRLEGLQKFADNAPAGLALEVFDEVEPDPSDVTCARGGAAAAECGAEAIIGIGGGSSMDAAKAIAAEAVQEGWTARQADPSAPTELNFDPLPIILAPTTAGTASEVTPFSVITYTETQTKLVLSHDRLYAEYGLLDPRLLTTAPKNVRMAAGMDALTHAMESMVSRKATDQTRRRALESIELVARNLPDAVADPDDLQAQAETQRGAMIAGLAFSKSRLGIVHAMALPLSALFGVPHGLANAVLLPHGMQFNYMADTDNYARAAKAMGVDTSAMSEQAAALGAVEAVRDLSEEVGAPANMSEVGVERDAIPRMAEDAFQSAHIACNPREIELTDLIDVYNEAY